MRREMLECSLRSLVVGDAWGRQVFFEEREVPWRYTDDSVMAMAVVGNLLEYNEIEQEALAQKFAQDFHEDPERGYGAVAHFILHQIVEGTAWEEASTMVYGGEGSKGNGAAMRVAPLGVYFEDSTDVFVMEQARKSALVTHAHPDGIAGAQAVALASWMLVRDMCSSPHAFLEYIARKLPKSEVREGIERAVTLGACTPKEAGRVLGSGEKILAEDTVPLSLWLAAYFHRDFEEAMSMAKDSFRGFDADADTICAIVGGVIGAVCGETIPQEWLDETESWGFPAI